MTRGQRLVLRPRARTDHRCLPPPSNVRRMVGQHVFDLISSSSLCASSSRRAAAARPFPVFDAGSSRPAGEMPSRGMAVNGIAAKVTVLRRPGPRSSSRRSRYRDWLGPARLMAAETATARNTAPAAIRNANIDLFLSAAKGSSLGSALGAVSAMG